MSSRFFKTIERTSVGWTDCLTASSLFCIGCCDHQTLFPYRLRKRDLIESPVLQRKRLGISASLFFPLPRREMK